MSQPVDERPRKRVRLAPAVRVEQILDAALQEFSAHGFGAARMACIARRVGMSKAGLYAHFSGKEAIFEALLQTLLAPDFPNAVWLCRDARTLEQVIDAYLDDVYCTMADPKALSVLRLVIAESARVPHLLRNWTTALRRHLNEQQNIISQCAEEGSLRPSPVTDCFALAFSPALYCAIWQLIHGDTDAENTVSLIRRAHRQWLIEALRPAA